MPFRTARGLRLRPLLLAWALLAAAPGARGVEIGLVVDDREELKDSLRAASLLIAAKRGRVDDNEELIAAAQADYRRLLGTLYAEGYYGAVIRILVDGREAADLAPFDAPERIERIDIRVEPGPRFSFGTAEVAPRAPATALPEGFAPGQRARSGAIRDAARAGIAGWRLAGHPLATVTGQEISAHHPSATLDARILLDPGERARFGTLRFPMGGAVRAERIRQIAGLPSGEVFSTEVLDRMATRLRRSGAFGAVALNTPGPVTPEGLIDVQAELADRPPRRLGFGGEIASTEGLALTGYWLHRNLLGGAERLRLDAAVSEIGGAAGGMDFELKGEFTRPATFTPDTDLRFFLGAERRDEPDFRTDTLRGEAGVVHHFSDRLEGRLALGLEQTRSRDDFGKRNFTLLLLPSGLRWDGRDNALDATRGIYADLGLTPFVDRQDTAPSLRLTFDGRTYQSLGERLVLAARGQLGSIAGVADLDQIPADFLFFSGGGGTVRGHDFQELGAEIGGGREVGGRAFAALSLEARVRVSGRIGVVPFLDLGYVGPEQFPYGDGDWHAGAGLGLRYDIGIAPLRFDVAVPVRGEGSRPVAFYIGIGQAF
ncbi:MAG: hypothetical protein CVT80_04445 [Alphaproteobacteria bacterium HGW-Alphaproteobacteria-2]|nr:MAG: hypothetical protein CVT80_04445 [Alphaproteobacteria bacterium HGW-Alphaproteobacteria-2]